jgi:hypothetical protein
MLARMAAVHTAQIAELVRGATSEESMKIKAVVCRVDDENGNQNVLANVTLDDFIAYLGEMTAEPEDELAALERELAGYQPQANAKTPAQEKAENEGRLVPGDALASARPSGQVVVIPRSNELVVNICNAKTRGDVYAALDMLLSQFGARLAKDGEVV